MKKYRSQFQKEHDRAEIARLVRGGYLQVDIAHRLGISPQLVGKEIKSMEAQWRESMLSDITGQKAAELARLNQMEAELWTSWETSKAEGKRRSQQWALTGMATPDDPNHKPTPVRVSLSTENEQGDPRYMAQIIAVSDRRCKLLGLDAPIKIDPSWTGGTSIRNLTLEERVIRAKAMMAKVSA